MFADAGPRPEQNVVPGRPLEADETHRGDRPVRATRAVFELTLPDEHATLHIERVLRLDDDGERATALWMGAGLPITPGPRVAAHVGIAGFALVATDGNRYRASSPDDVHAWFAGDGSVGASSVTFHRNGSTITAARGDLTVTLLLDREGPARPLSCRMLVALWLGGDSSSARDGCRDARMPERVTVRHRQTSVASLARSSREDVELPARSLAVPPALATPDLALPAAASSGAFFAPVELARLPGAHDPANTLTVHNALARSALVFVDDLAVGWVGAGATTMFVGLSGGSHTVRGRSLDGVARSRAAIVSLPGTQTLSSGGRP